MKKILATGLGILMCTATLVGAVGCGGGEDDYRNEDAEVEITYATTNDADERDLMKVWAKAFMKKHKEVQISSGAEISGMDDLIRGVDDDIIWTAGDQHAPYSALGAAGTDADGNPIGYFQNLSDETKFPGSADFFKDFYPSVIETTHYSPTDTGIWFVPRDYNRLVVYINKDAFTAAGLEVPDNDWTWDDFIDICNQFTSVDVKYRAKAGVHMKNWFPINYTVLRNLGGEYLDEQGNLVIEDAKYSAGVKAYYDFYSNFYEETDEHNSYGSNREGAEQFTLYTGVTKNCVPMSIGVRPSLPSHLKASKANNFELCVRSFPNYKQGGENGYVGMGCSGYGISSSCTDSEKLHWAWEFLKFCMSQEGYAEVGDTGMIVPALMSLRDDEEEGSWRFYGDLDEDSAEAFVDTHANDLALSYAYSLPSGKINTFNDSCVKRLWTDAQSGISYETAIATFKQTFGDLIKK